MRSLVERSSANQSKGALLGFKPEGRPNSLGALCSAVGAAPRSCARAELWLSRPSAGVRGSCASAPETCASKSSSIWLHQFGSASRAAGRIVKYEQLQKQILRPTKTYLQKANADIDGFRAIKPRAIELPGADPTPRSAKEAICEIVKGIRFFYAIDRYGIEWEFEEGHADIGTA